MKLTSILALSLLFLAVAVVPVLSAQNAPAQTFKLKVTAEQANLREKPDIGSGVVQQIPEGTVLEADKKEGEWYLVRYTLEDGGVIAGYIHESLVMVLEPSPGAGGQPSRETNPEARTKPGSETRPAAPGAQSDSWYEVRLPFDLFISAGGGTVVADDFTEGARGLADLNAAGTTPSGSVGALRLTYVFGLEVSYRLSRWFSVGLATEFLRGWRRSTITYPDMIVVPEVAGPRTATHVFVQAVPVKLGFRFYPRPDFYIRASAAYYFVRAGYDDRFGSSILALQEWQGRATAHTLGLEVAAGGEWRLASNLFFFAEAGFRLTSAFGLAGTGTTRDSSGAELSEAGPLWFYQQLGADDRGHDLLFVHAAEPSGTGILSARKAALNLSGTTARLGVKVRF
jgi:hypothetical protein